MENAFALLVARWRLLKNEIQAKPEYVEIYTKACCILHNYLQSESGDDRFDVDFDTETKNLLPVELSLSNLESNSGGIRIREQFKDYFMVENVLNWQYDHVMYDGYNTQ